MRMLPSTSGPPGPPTGTRYAVHRRTDVRTARWCADAARRGPAPRARRATVATVAGCSRPRDPGPSPVDVGPWRRRSRAPAYANPWIEVFHDEVDRPGRQPGDLRRRPLPVRGGRRGRRGRGRPAPARRPAPLRARRVQLGDPRGRRRRGRVAGRRRAARAARGDRVRRRRLAAAVPADGVQLRDRRARRDLRRDAACAQGRPRPSRPRTWRSAGRRSTRCSPRSRRATSTT